MVAGEYVYQRKCRGAVGVQGERVAPCCAGAGLGQPPAGGGEVAAGERGPAAVGSR
ncbi:hypothetical protein ACLFMI_15070 [Pseudonocardia nantongensis]|uniref:hypothetical protein n=1 Tax=Pseudonocardia nantongensis TaxID=1181885 RepID=UPI00397B6386